MHSIELFAQLIQRNGINNVNLHASNVEVFPGQSNTVNLPPLLQIETNQRGKHNGKSKVSRNAKSAAQMTNGGNLLFHNIGMNKLNCALICMSVVTQFSHYFLFFMFGGLFVSESLNAAAVNNCRYDSSLGTSMLE